MNKERFTKLVEILDEIPVDTWAIAVSKREDKTLYIHAENVRIYTDGELQVSDIIYTFSFWQKRKVIAFYKKITEEIALRTLQRSHNIA